MSPNKKKGSTEPQGIYQTTDFSTINSKQFIKVINVLSKYSWPEQGVAIGQGGIKGQGSDLHSPAP